MIEPTESFLKLNGTPVKLSAVTEFVNDNDLAHIEISLQSAPVLEVGIDGLQIDDIIMMVHDIIESFNQNFSCQENDMVLKYLQEAKKWCDIRTKNRQNRNVEGKSTA